MEALGYDKVPLEVTKMVSLPVLAHYHVKSCYDTVDLPPWLYTVTVHCPQNVMPVFSAHLFKYVGNLCSIHCVCRRQLLYCTWSFTTEAPEPVPEAVLVPVVPVHAPELTCQFQLHDDHAGSDCSPNDSSGSNQSADDYASSDHNVNTRAVPDDAANTSAGIYWIAFLKLFS